MSGRLHNRTRQSPSIVRALLRRGRVAEIPLYYLMRLSDLAREGLDHSGSHRFADHIYRGVPSGRGTVGTWLDRLLLSLPAVRSFRSRYLAASREVAAFLIDRATQADNRPIRVLSVPCGIPRELADAADAVRTRLGVIPARVEFHGIDLDRDVLNEACAFARDRGVQGFRAHQGDALSRAAYPVTFDCITCTGLGEFLDDDELAQLYGIFFDVLEAEGLLITSAMLPRRASDYLLRLAELRTHYRGPRDLERMVTRRPFRDVHVEMDAVGLQSILTARK